MAKWDHDDLRDKTPVDDLQMAFQAAGHPPDHGQLVVSTFDNPPHKDGSRECQPAKAATRTFGTGATRDTDEGKLDFEGFLSPLVLEEFAKYMHEKRKMPDGSLRNSDNWQLGIPVDQYMKSMFRHFFAVWRTYRRDTKRGAGYDYASLVEELLALHFNVQGMTHEILKEGGKR